MKKVVNIFHAKDEGSENKSITKNVSDLINHVDTVISSSISCYSIFSPRAISSRMKLREACERVLSQKNPLYNQKMEEIIWRKVYYEPLSTAKKLRKDTKWSHSECGLIWAHLNDGIAFYHHYIISVIPSNESSSNFADMLPLFNFDEDVLRKGEHQSLNESYFRSLTCLGDLARYMLDLPHQLSDTSSYLLSVRYYLQALHCNSEGGLTHSNLATVYSMRGNHLLAVLHYLRAMTCHKPFLAAENNLKRMVERSRIWLTKEKLSSEIHSTKEVSLEKKSTLFLNSCFSLLACFISNRKMEEIAGLCQDVLLQLGKLLDDYDNVELPDFSEASSDNSDQLKHKEVLNGCVDATPGVSNKFSSKGDVLDYTFLLTPETMVIQCSLFILCSKYLQKIDSNHYNMSQVLLISILLTLTTHINNRLEQSFSLIDPSFVQKLLPKEESIIKTEATDNLVEKEEKVLVNGDKKSKRSKLSKLRRRKKFSSNFSDQGVSEEEEGDYESDGVYDGNESDASNYSDIQLPNGEEEGNIDASVLCSSEDDSDEDVKIEDCEELWEGMSAAEHLDLAEQEEMLAAVHVLLHWLYLNQDLVKTCGKGADNLWKSLAKLFNLIKVDYNSISKQGCSTTKKVLLERLSHVWNAGNVGSQEFKEESTCSVLPERVILFSVLPEFCTPSTSLDGFVNTSDMDLCRLFDLNNVMIRLTGLRDVPLRLNDEGKLVKCDGSKTVKGASEIEEKKLVNGKASPTVIAAMSDKKLNGHMDESSSKTSICDMPVNHPTLNSTTGNYVTDKSKVLSSMQNLTAQWLQHEVKNLERKTISSKSGPCGLYLVPDASVLINCLTSVKRILSGSSYMVIIPQAVIDSLDYQKKDSVGARDAIRWLESKLRHGSRFMRTQRTHERTHIPLIKYPKRKEKEAWEWVHIAECGHYLSAQMNKSNFKLSTVSILTIDKSFKVPKTNLSLKTLAEASGCTLKSVDELLKKWQKNASSNKDPS